MKVDGVHKPCFVCTDEVGGICDKHNMPFILARADAALCAPEGRHWRLDRLKMPQTPFERDTDDE